MYAGAICTRLCRRRACAWGPRACRVQTGGFAHNRWADLRLLPCRRRACAGGTAGMPIAQPRHQPAYGRADVRSFRSKHFETCVIAGGWSRDTAGRGSGGKILLQGVVEIEKCYQVLVSVARQRACLRAEGSRDTHGRGSGGKILFKV